MKKQYLFLAAALMALPAAAQETYENAKIADEDLNGTARYVGMGGAMEALGADISTMSSNPAGIGLMRHTQASVSGGIVSQSGLPSNLAGKKTYASFDQVGVVFNLTKGQRTNVNVGFNYHKSKNFDFILYADNSLSGASQNKLTYEKLRNGYVYPTNSDGSYGTSPYWSANQLDTYYADTYFIDGNNKLYDGTYGNATEYGMVREHTGYIGNYDFNISGNIGSQVYWGVTVGVKDVHYKHKSAYTEILENNSAVGTGDNRQITGNGFDIKAGVIVRPVAESPFRIGAYVHTPTWYDLTTSNYTEAFDTSTDGAPLEKVGSESYDYKIFTPWKFGLSLGHTVGNWLALGATYEYADYGSINSRIIDDYGYNYWDGYYESSSADKAMNDHTQNTLKGVSTFKIGAEVKPVKNFAVRVGYNYVSPKYSEDGYKDVTLESPGNYFASQTDYTNWKATNRFTFGLGYTLKKFTVDVAYQFSTQKGEFYPFTSYYENGASGAASADDCIATAAEVKNNRNQFLLTLGYHF